jgi:tRNA A37 methylthiotransferase MiaB
MKTACVIFPIGCHRSNLDAALFVDYFQANSWKITTRLEEADIILIGTCGVSQGAERASLEILSKIKKRVKNEPQIVVYGCLAGINATIIREYGAIPISKSDFSQLDSMINSRVRINSLNYPHLLSNYARYLNSRLNFFDVSSSKYKLSLSYFLKYYSKILQYYNNRVSLDLIGFPDLFTIKIATGCMGKCTYCAIKFGIGPLRSWPLEAILNEFRSGLEKGYGVFRFSADDVGAYGQDIGLSIVDLLRGVFKAQENFKLILDDFSPKWLVQYSSELLKIFADEYLRIGYIAMPMQSGSEKILQMMGREYKARDTRRLFLALRKAAPQIDLRTHVLLGFPGETERDFSDTLNFLENIQFNLVSIFKYSERINTEAAELPDKVPEKVMLKRAWKVLRAFPPGKVICAF